MSTRRKLRVRDLKIILEDFDDNLPVVVTREGKGHDYGIVNDDICIIEDGYFGNDPEAWDAFENDKEFLQLVSI